MTAPNLPLVVFGAGGHGKVIADLVRANGEVVAGFLDDRAPPDSLVLGLKVLGSADWLSMHRARVALGIGDNALRERIAEACVRSGSQLHTAIHPRAVVASSAMIEAGVVIMPLAVVNSHAIVKRGAIINSAAVVEHDCVVGDFAHISPNAALGGGCHVERLAQLGIGATMLPRTRIGTRTIVGAGSVVMRDVPAHAVAFGTPAKVFRMLDAPES